MIEKIALVLSLVLPGSLFVGSVVRLYGSLQAPRSLGEYLWATCYVMVFCFSAFWLTASMLSVHDMKLSAERVHVTLTAGPPFFFALGWPLFARRLLAWLTDCMRGAIRHGKAGRSSGEQP